MTSYLLSSHHRYRIELTSNPDEQASFYVHDEKWAQDDCDCSSDCACSSAENTLADTKIHIEFINRDEEQKKIIYAADNLVIDAPAGFGKTFLLRRVADEMRQQGWKVIYQDLAAVDRKPIPQNELARALMQQIDPVSTSTEISTQGLAKALGSSDKIIMIFDTLESNPQVLPWLKGELIPNLRITLDSTLRVVFAGRYVYSNSSDNEWPPEAYTPLHLRPLKLEDILKVLKQQANILSIEKQTEMARWVLWLSGGHPATIEALINELYEYGWHLRLPVELEQLKEIFHRRICPYFLEVKQFAPSGLQPDIDVLCTFRVLDRDIIGTLQTLHLMESSQPVGDIISDLRNKARLIEPVRSFLSDAVFRRMISVAVDVLQHEQHLQYHRSALTIFEEKLKSLLKNRPMLNDLLIEDHLSEIFYHTVQLALPEDQVVKCLMENVCLLPNDFPRRDLIVAALRRDENQELDIKIQQQYKSTRLAFIEKVCNDVLEKLLPLTSPNPNSLAQILIEGTVQVVSIRADENGKIVGTGFLTRYEGRDLAITCSHVLIAMKKQEKDEVLMVSKDGTQDYKARIISTIQEEKSMTDLGAEEDIAVLSLLDAPKSTWNWDAKFADAGTVCTVFGYGESGGKLGMNVLVQIGSELAEQFRQLDCMANNPYVEMEEGMSGAPVSILGKSGLVGMFSGLTRKRGHTIYGDFIPADLIERKLNTLLQFLKEDKDAIC